MKAIDNMDQNMILFYELVNEMAEAECIDWLESFRVQIENDIRRIGHESRLMEKHRALCDAIRNIRQRIQSKSSFEKKTVENTTESKIKIKKRPSSHKI